MQLRAPSRGWCVQVFRVSPDRAPVLVEALRSAEPGAHPAIDGGGAEGDSVLVIETRDDPALLERVRALVLAEDAAAVRAHVSRVDPSLLEPA